MAGLATACERPSLDPLCTAVASGQILVTELRGSQSGTDTWGQWIELHNTGDTAVDLAGLVLRITRLDGSGEKRITVRRPGVVIDAHGYAVLGRFSEALRPAHVDYGYGDEVAFDLYPDGIIEVLVCNTLVDTVIYRNLPKQGSLSLDGDVAPSAEANDLETNWCVDAEDVGGDPTQVGIPGTPGEQNRPCP
jgi:hypothetical protein